MTSWCFLLVQFQFALRLPGIDLPGIFHVRTVPDVHKINEFIEKGNPFLAGMHRYSGFQTLRPKDTGQ